MSGRLRGGLRALLLAGGFGAAAVGVTAIAIVSPLTGDRGARLRAALFRAWSCTVARIVGLRIESTGAAPRGPFLLVANHLSYLDVIVLGATVRATFVAKADVATWPLIGWLCSAVGTVFLDRTRKRDLLRVLPILEQRLRAGGGVVVFPEGTTGDGSRVLPFRSPLFAAAIRAGVPAHVATLTYETPAGAAHPSRAVCWWGDMAFLPHLLAFLRLPQSTARLAFVRHPIVERDRKRLARAAHAGVARRFVPVRRGEEECLPFPSTFTSPAAAPRPPTSASFVAEPSS